MTGLRYFTALCFAVIAFVKSATGQITDVSAAFDQIGAVPKVIRLANDVKTPSGGHLQGIQPLNDSLLVITASSGDYSYYLVADQRRIRSIQKISDSPFRHAGGCQVAGHTLLVGVEDNIAKDRSDIYSIRMNDAGNEADKAIVASRQGIFKRSTAGATGYVEARGSWLAAVADWDSRNIDFYASVQDSVVLLGTAIAPDSLHWCAYQSVNLILDKSEKLYMIGLGLDGTRDRADLFEVQFDRGKAALRLVRTRYFKCKGASFRYGAGIHTAADGRLEIYTCARNPASRIAVNIFK